MNFLGLAKCGYNECDTPCFGYELRYDNIAANAPAPFCGEMPVTHEYQFNSWTQPDVRPHLEAAQGECKTTKEQETRCWERTVLVPDGMQPIDLIRRRAGNLSLPPFHALQLTVNKRDVECIASAMTNPNLRWHNMYYFTIAPYDAPNDDRHGEWVLISGHHRFLAYVLSGAPPTDTCPLRLIKAPLAMSLFLWSDVIWSK